MADKEYGIIIKDASGNKTVLTPDVGVIISTGRVTMPSGLVDTNKYYTTIALGATMDFSDLAVLAIPVKWYVNVVDYALNVASMWQDTFLLDDAKTYYTRAEATGIITAYPAGDMTTGDPTEWDAVCSCYPIAYWEQLAATSASSIKIFAGMCYCCSPAGEDVPNIDFWPEDNFKFGIYDQGVEIIDYAIIAKNYD